MEWNKLKKMAALGLAGTMLLGAVMSASAAPVGTPATTDADVTFVAGEINITDPPTPDDEDDEKLEPPLVPGGDKNLAVFAPHLNFATVEIVDEDREYPVKAQTTVNDGSIDSAKAGEIKYMRNYIAVTDQRGTNKGWDVSVQIADKFKTTDTTVEHQELDGISLFMRNGDVISKTNNTPATDVKGIDTLTLTNEVEVVPAGSEVKIFEADAPNGQGTFIQSFGADDTKGSTLITQVDPTSTADPKPNYKDAKDGDVLFNKDIVLSVPQGTKLSAASYNAKLTWVISSTP